jgi:outer membrane lipoprotein-sorting protein
MKYPDSIENVIKNFCASKRSAVKTTTELDRRIIDASLLAQEKLKQTQSASIEPNIWRIIMKSQVTKLTAAAVIIVAVVLLVTILNNSTSTEWAIEQSIEAVSKYKAIVIEGFDSERTWIEGGSLGLRPFKSWNIANEDQTMVEKYRHEVDGVPTLITDGQKTWRYDLETNTVRIEDHPYIASECWCGSQFLEQIKSYLGTLIHDWEVTYGKDPATGKQRAFLKIAWLEKRYNGPRSMWFEFDMESKLLVSFKQWENANWEGSATLVGEKITYYENLPDELFEFEIPEGATVIEE